MSRPAEGPTSGRRRLQVDERRQLLIEAAQRLFSSRALDDVSVDDIATESGASRALLYHYFSSKQDLYVAALREAADELVRRVTAVREPDGDALQRLDRAVDAYISYADAHATGFMTLLRGGPGATEGVVGSVVQSVRDTLHERILEGLGVQEPPPLLRVALRAWLAIVETAVLDWLDRRDVDRDLLKEYLVSAMPALLASAHRLDPEVPLGPPG